MLTVTAHSGVPEMRKAASGAQRRKRRLSPFWAKQLHLWHWMSSAICLVGMLLFAITGITLNHAADVSAQPQTTTSHATLPNTEQRALAGAAGEGAVPAAVAIWVQGALGARIAGRPTEWDAAEVYIALPQPGGDGWVSIDRQSGLATYEHTDRGWISWLNDLHKGRDTGSAWRWFIDIFAVACVIFSLTGFLLLWLHSRHRRMTWPLVGAGLVIPMLVILLFLHA